MYIVISRRANPCATSAAICLERSGGQWGYKPLDESMHPYYYSCPLSYLDLAPEQSAEWRAGVRAYHARRRTPTAVTAPAATLMV